MVQYILTPWRHRRELLAVRRQFYPDETADAAAPGGADDEARREEKHRAVARVSVWMQRGGCPHLVESTALLTAAILSDAASSSAAPNGGSGSAGTYAARAAYAAAFSRFVTGLLDGQQDKLRKLSMYSLAKTIGLPATFVELRHQATHEQLPSLAKLRSAARKALGWIWEYYWRQLADKPSLEKERQIGVAGQGGDDDACREAILEVLGGEQDESSTARLVEQWGDQEILRALEGITDSPPSNGAMLKALRMTREVLLLQATRQVADETMKDAESTNAELVNDDSVAEDTSTGDGTGWSHYQGSWKPRPIGIA